VAKVEGLHGPVECTVRSQGGDSLTCGGDLVCTQAGTVGELDVAAMGRVYTHCERSGADSWSCDCSDNVLEATATIEVQANDGWDACTAAANDCPGEVNLF
jgi:hypothetical protein